MDTNKKIIIKLSLLGEFNGNFRKVTEVCHPNERPTFHMGLLRLKRRFLHDSFVKTAEKEQQMTKIQ